MILLKVICVGLQTSLSSHQQGNGMIQIVTESLDFHSDMLHRQNFPNKIFMLSKYELYTMLMTFVASKPRAVSIHSEVECADWTPLVTNSLWVPLYIVFFPPSFTNEHAR